VKKSRVEKHYQTECPGCSVLSCIDCGKDFTGEEYQAHTSCISEAEKYQGKLFTESDRTKSNKGERKQQEWLQKVQEVEKTTTDPGLVRYLKMIAAYPNVPRKQAKFEHPSGNQLIVPRMAGDNHIRGVSAFEVAGWVRCVYVCVCVCIYAPCTVSILLTIL
jgi:cell growth-regulating nucleolar protein